MGGLHGYNFIMVDEGLDQVLKLADVYTVACFYSGDPEGALVSLVLSSLVSSGCRGFVPAMTINDVIVSYGACIGPSWHHCYNFTTKLIHFVTTSTN